VDVALEAIPRRAGLVTGSHSEEELVRQMLQTRIDQWLAVAQSLGSGAVLGYAPRRDGRTVELLRKPTEERSLFTCLNSLRDVEPNVTLILRDHGMDRQPGEPPQDDFGASV
jgi:hypothetical protein